MTENPLRLRLEELVLEELVLEELVLEELVHVLEELVIYV